MQSAARVTEERPATTFPTGETLLPRSEEFARHFNRQDFLFPHGLAHHPMFEPKALLDLANRIPKLKDFVFWQNGRIKVNDKWEANPGPRTSLEETLRDIEHNNSLVILKHAEQDPVYGPLLQEILQRIFSFTSPAHQDDILLGESLIFITSPRRNTAYHLDLESNFLLQIKGQKLCYVHSPANRNATPDIELENFCSGDHNGAIYKAERAAEASTYPLKPGEAVHFPSTAPHWVTNDDNVSVSININFDTKSIHRRLKRIYSMNRLIRRTGISPTPPGQSAFSDALKVGVADSVNGIINIARGRAKENRPDPAVAAYPAWHPVRETR